MTCALPQPTSVTRTRPQASATAPAATSARPPTPAFGAGPDSLAAGSREDRGGQADRDVDPEDPVPVQALYHCAADQWATGDREPADGTPVPDDRAATLGGNAAARIVRLTA